MHHPRPATVGQLKETGYRPCSVKDELRRNLIRKLKAGEELFPGIVGYRDTVIPQIVNGILSKHDLLFLGLRGPGQDAHPPACFPSCWMNGCRCWRASRSTTIRSRR